MIQDALTPSLLAYTRTISSLVIILIPIVFSLHLLRPVRHLLGSLIPDIVQLDSLHPPSPPTAAQKRYAAHHGLRLWRQLVLVSLGIVEAAVWMAVVGVQITALKQSSTVRDILLASGMVFVWVGGPER